VIAVGLSIGHMHMRRIVIRHIVVTSYAGGRRIWVFGLWLSFHLIPLCMGYHIGLDSLLFT